MIEIGLPGYEEIWEAAKVVHRSMPPTPQFSWPLLNKRVDAEVWVKHENHTPVGAFKIRGGLVYMDWLRRERPEVETVISATRGNHGQSIAFAAGQVGIRAVIVVPHGNSVEKNRAMRALGAELIEFGKDYQAASDHAIGLAETNGWHRVPSYDRRLVTGVATGTMEFLEGCPELETVYVAIGMGSGISAMMAARDALGLSTRIVGVVSTEAPAMALSFAAGTVMEHAVTTAIADGVACRKPDAGALGLVRAGVDRIVRVTDAKVEEAMRAWFADTHQVVEGAGAIGLGALLQERRNGIVAAGGRVGLVISGGNVDSDVFARVLAG
jgi:threonine dehydratase